MKKYAREYQCASKKDKGRMLDEAVAVTGWSRANARRAIVAAANREGPARAVRREPSLTARRGNCLTYRSSHPRVGVHRSRSE